MRVILRILLAPTVPLPDKIWTSGFYQWAKLTNECNRSAIPYGQLRHYQQRTCSSDLALSFFFSWSFELRASCTKVRVSILWVDIAVMMHHECDVLNESYGLVQLQ